jgi:hypothetical protein
MLDLSLSYFRYIRRMGLPGSAAGHAAWVAARAEDAE